MRRTFAMCAALAALLPAAARADWAYTKWGMTPQEAVTASNGAMKLLPANARKKEDLTHTEKVAEGEFEDGALRLRVEFLIDTDTGGLVCVTYTPSDATRNDALKDALTKRYGPPMGAIPAGTVPVELLAWDRPDTINYSAAKGYAAGVIHCKKGGPMG
jgi:hypothetical protein